MLNSADRALIQRDSAIPGLATVLEPTAMVNLLMTNNMPVSDIRGASIHYVRYKPGVNCLIGYTLDTTTGPIDIYAKAFNSASDNKRYKLPNACLSNNALGNHSLVVDELALVLNVFPYDRHLGILHKLHVPETRTQILQKLLPNQPQYWQGSLQKLRYKPERRYVARLMHEGKTVLALKCYGDMSFNLAYTNSKLLYSQESLQLAHRLGRSRRHRLLAFEWIDGESLAKLIQTTNWQAQDILNTGEALGRLHQQNSKGLHRLSRSSEAETLNAVALWLGSIEPKLSRRYMALAQKLSAHLMALAPQDAAIHGDFYADQVLINNGRAAILDLDRAVSSDPAADLGNFQAHLHRDVILGRLDADSARLLYEYLLLGYRESKPLPDKHHLDLYCAASLLRLAPECFRRRYADWPNLLQAHLVAAEEQLATLRHTGIGPAQTQGVDSIEDTEVIDPFGIADDPGLAFAASALDPVAVAVQLRQQLSHYSGDSAQLQVTSIRVLRHKPGRRCLVQYQIQTQSTAHASNYLTLMGKINAKRPDKAGFALLQQLWQHGFDDHSADGTSVAQAMGIIPQWHMLLQRQVPGDTATEVLARGDSSIAKHIAEAIDKLHRTGIPARRQHSMEDELRILGEHLYGLSRQQPAWAERLYCIMQACKQLAQASATQPSCGIHRDFYPDQVLIAGQRLYLLDLDLYCEGEPALDTGNFIAHLMEQGLRTQHDPMAMQTAIRTLEQHFVALHGKDYLPRLQTYVTLSLARHISLSRLFEQRKPFTTALMTLCEQRLGLTTQTTDNTVFMNQS